MKADSIVLTGEKVFLREMGEADALFIITWRNDPEIKKWMGKQTDLTLEEHITWFRKRNNRFDYMICDKTNGLPIGTLNYTIVENSVAELGKLLGNKDYRGLGYAKEATSLWLKAGFTIFGFSKIIANTKSENETNIRLNQKLGFKIATVEKLNNDQDMVSKYIIMELRKEEFHE